MKEVSNGQKRGGREGRKVGVEREKMGGGGAGKLNRKSRGRQLLRDDAAVGARDALQDGGPPGCLSCATCRGKQTPRKTASRLSAIL